MQNVLQGSVLVVCLLVMAAWLVVYPSPAPASDTLPLRLKARKGADNRVRF